MDFVGQIILNKSSGELEHVFYDEKIATHIAEQSIPSRPQQDQFDAISCSKGGAISENQNLTTRDQVEAHFKASNDARKMPSLADIKPQTASASKVEPKSSTEAKK
ncbi:MAG: hypothetical protein IPK04_01905 [Bdellovibrionales bacterium]|nr:hypothetical protein [Bdellovibrionales bacterium]